jgi:hypothetical protein
MPGCAAVVRSVLLSGGRQGEEARAGPGRAGNRPRDRRQAGIGLSVPDVAFGLDRDGVALAAIVADQHGPDLEVALGLRPPFCAGTTRRAPAVVLDRRGRR